MLWLILSLFFIVLGGISENKNMIRLGSASVLLAPLGPLVLAVTGAVVIVIGVWTIILLTWDAWVNDTVRELKR